MAEISEVQVVKKDGSKEAFNVEKLRNSMKKSVLDAEEDLQGRLEEIEKIAKEVVEETKEKGSATTAEVRTAVLEKLKAVDEKAAAAWEKFDSKYKEKKQ